ncbi:MAG: hypothetical protein KA118_07980 [Verrucomicrobia bacterium]|nr:hypothetical protein [Verrucomicrobiota bacterium]
MILRRRARKIPQCPPPGEGVHTWLASAAKYCQIFGKTPVQAVAYLTAHMTRPPSSSNEVQSAVAFAYKDGPDGSKTRMPGQYARRPVPIQSVQYDEARLRAAASRITIPSNWRHWLYSRSPVRPDSQNALSFLAQLYRAGETILVFDRMETPKPLQRFRISVPMNCSMNSAELAIVKEGGRFQEGIWFLCNPVDGAEHPNPRQNNKLSCRSEESVTSFRYAVLESDIAPANLWLACIVQFPIRIAAIYTSGSRSIHTLVQLNAPTKAAWDAEVSQWKRPLRVLGCDVACLSGVRLTRLPGCARPGKGYQKLLYLAPNPPLARLIDLPIICTRTAELQRWRELCPRWNPEMRPDNERIPNDCPPCDFGPDTN